jgi:hypothetical protein
MTDPACVDWGAYVDIASAAVGLPIDPSLRAGVVANLERMAQVAQVLEPVVLTDTDEAAGVFHP